MFIFIPTGMRYSARAWGSTVKEVRCAHCGTEFVYELRRMVTGESSAPAFIGTASGPARAQAGAQQLLAKTLATDHDLIACPKCGRLQPAMNWIVRRRWLAWMAVGWAFVCIVALFGYLGAPLGREPAWWTFWFPVAATVLLVGGTVWLMLKEFGGGAADRAQLKEEAEAQGYVRLGMPRVLKDGWIWVRATLFRGARVCAGCGAEATQVLRRKLWFLPMEAGVCGACYRSAKWKRFAWGAVSFLVPMGIVVWLFVRDPNWDQIDLVMGLMIGAMAGGAVLGVVANWFLGKAGMPVRFRRYRPRQDSVEVKFRSEKAAEDFLAGAIERMMGDRAGG